MEHGHLDECWVVDSYFRIPKLWNIGFLFLSKRFPTENSGTRRVRHDATESSDNLAQATKTCRNLLQVDYAKKKNMSCFPMETPISNQGETCGYLPLSKPKPSLIKIGTTANMQPPLVPETPGLGAPKSTAPRCKAMFLSHKIDTWHFARRRRRPEAFQKKQPRLLRSHWKEARAQVRCNLSLWNFKGLHGSDLVFGITSFSQKIPAWFGKHLSCTWKRPWHEPGNTSWWIVNRSLWLAS